MSYWSLAAAQFSSPKKAEISHLFEFSVERGYLALDLRRTV
ncbi:MAG: hypothetical protein ACXVIO_11705 [Candidatus Angelobacter sp.]